MKEKHLRKGERSGNLNRKVMELFNNNWRKFYFCFLNFTCNILETICARQRRERKENRELFCGINLIPDHVDVLSSQANKQTYHFWDNAFVRILLRIILKRSFCFRATRLTFYVNLINFITSIALWIKVSSCLCVEKVLAE